MVRQFASRNRPSGFMLAFLVALSACLLAVGGLFGPIEDALTSRRAEFLTRQPTGQTVIVEIDARSVSELRSWPWPRQYHARLVRQLHKSGVAIIAFDVDFSAQSASGDEEFSAAIRQAGNVILPIFDQKSAWRDDHKYISSRPTAALADAWVGGVNIFPDADGVVRQYPAAIYVEGAIQPSIATLLAEKNGLADRTFQPDWAIEADRIPRISFVDVINGRIPASSLQGKRILVGATAIELGDRYAVPRYGVVPGVVIQALAAESLLQDRAIRYTGVPVTLVIVLVLALLLVPRPLDRPARYVAWTVLLLLTILAVPFIAQQIWAVSVDSAAWLFTLFAASAVQAVVEFLRRIRLREELDGDSGLPNRTMLEKAVARTEEGRPILIAAAIERFDAIRNGIGLAATNDMIRNAADIIGRQVDCAVYRIAPDVLAWVMPGEEDAAFECCLKAMQMAFREPVVTRAGHVDVAFTLGMARRESGLPAVLLIENALSAISVAKSHGRSREWYRPSDPQLRRQLSMMSDLRESMKDNRLSLFYQPKMSIATGRIGDAEALIRWHDVDGKLVPPDEFIPFAESTGMIREVTSYALRAAVRDLAQWSKRGVTVRIAVNVSALDLGTPEFAEMVSSILSEFAVPAELLALEVTESALIRSTEIVAKNLSTLREHGVRLSVDDYGTGQSTLSYLKHLPIHELKIDKSFVMTMASNQSDQIMVRSTINLAHELGLQVVAEGIEDGETLDLLRGMGCDYAQGYHISKPVLPDQFIALASNFANSRRVA
jgi:EAL domain-containing protein (putative c-di-GMP-specific phosphodiesterase class I)/CHASE2 domain-containing sensor protein